MKKILLTCMTVALLMPACAVVPIGQPGGASVAVVAPVLPPLVVFDTEPFYFYNGFHYHYVNDRWFYSPSRRGPWTVLPRDHYPREVRYKYREHDRGRSHRRW